MLSGSLLLGFFRLCAGRADKVAVTLRVTGRCLPHAEPEAYLASTFGGEPFFLGLVAGPVLLFVLLAWAVRRRGKAQQYDPPWIPPSDPVPLDWTVQTLGGK